MEDNIVIHNKFFRNYYLNFFNAFFILFISIYYNYLWFPKVKKLTNYYYNGSNEFDIGLYKSLFTYIFVFIFLGFIILFLSLIFSNVYRNLKKLEDKFFNILLYLLIFGILIALSKNYFIILKNLLNYNKFYNIQFYCGYYEYLLINCLSIMVTCISSIDSFKNFIKNNLGQAIISSVFFLSLLSLRKAVLFYYSNELHLVFNIILFLSNVSMAKYEKKEYEKNIGRIK